MPDFLPLVAAAGRNDLDYAAPGLPGRQIILRSARPARWTAQTPVLFVHHGVERNGADYRDYWLPLVDHADLLVVVPEFPKTNFPGSAWYNFGNRTDPQGHSNPVAQWTYGVDAAVFAGLQAAGLSRQSGYGVWGHSAGAQYVHRMISLGLRDKVRIAVSANAGTYAMPDLSVAFPFGLGGTGLADDNLRALLGFPLAVMAGTDDVHTSSPNFPRDAAAMAQGATRYARAHRYFDAAQAQAARLGVTCAWSITDVPGVSHDGKRMAAAAAPFLSTALHT